VQSKLRNDQQLAADIANRAIHFALLVFENAQMLNLIGERDGVSLVIVFADAE